MNDMLILVPGLVLGLYTMLFFFYMGLQRRAAILGKDISIRFYRTFDQGREPERLKVLTRHASNLLETPVLFYVGLLFIATAGATNGFFMTLAWLYVAARFIHALIHLGSNNVSQRFLAFGSSVIILVIMWIGVLIDIIGR